MDLSNITEMIIDGKSVKSIRGDVYWNKPSQEVEPSLVLSSNKDILSYIDNDTATLTATVPSNVSATKCYFYDDSKVYFEKMVSYGNEYNVLFLDVNEEGTLILPNGSLGVTIYDNNGNELVGETNLSSNKWTYEFTNNSLYRTEDDGVHEVIQRKILEDVSSFTMKIILNNYLSMDDMTGHNVDVISNFPNSFVMSSDFNNNQCSVVYNSQENGNINFKAMAITDEGNLFSETYEIDDRYYYDTLEYTKLVTSSSSNEYFSLPSTKVFSDLPSNFEITYDLRATNYNFAFGFGDKNNLDKYYTIIGDNSSSLIVYIRDNSTSSDTILKTGNVALNEFKQYKIVKQGDTISFYYDGTLIGSKTVSWYNTLSSFCFKGNIWNKCAIRVKNLSIKKLSNIASVSLTCDKQILSYYDSEECVLSATVLDENNDGVSGESINFYADNILLGTATTNSSGVATYNYASTGSGDVEFTASCQNIMSETYSVEDCNFYSAEGFSYTSSSTTDRREAINCGFEYTPSSKFELSFTLADTKYEKRFYFVSKEGTTSSTNGSGIGANLTSYSINCVVRNPSNTFTNVSTSNPFDCKFVRDGDSLEMWVNSVLITTKTVTGLWETYEPFIFSWGIWNTGTITVTNVKVKAL